MGGSRNQYSGNSYPGGAGGMNMAYGGSNPGQYQPTYSGPAASRQHPQRQQQYGYNSNAQFSSTDHQQQQQLAEYGHYVQGGTGTQQTDSGYVQYGTSNVASYRQGTGAANSRSYVERPGFTYEVIGGDPSDSQLVSAAPSDAFNAVTKTDGSPFVSDGSTISGHPDTPDGRGNPTEVISDVSPSRVAEFPNSGESPEVGFVGKQHTLHHHVPYPAAVSQQQGGAQSQTYPQSFDYSQSYGHQQPQQQQQYGGYRPQHQPQQQQNNYRRQNTQRNYGQSPDPHFAPAIPQATYGYQQVQIPATSNHYSRSNKVGNYSVPVENSTMSYSGDYGRPQQMYGLSNREISTQSIQTMQQSPQMHGLQSWQQMPSGMNLFINCLRRLMGSCLGSSLVTAVVDPQSQVSQQQQYTALPPGYTVQQYPYNSGYMPSNSY
jgi:hypothetical protein